MPASAVNVPSAVPTLPNLFDAYDADDGDDYPVVSPRNASSRAPSSPLSPPPPRRPTPLRLASLGDAVAPRQTLVTTPVTIPAPPPSESLLVMFDDEDEAITRETLLAPASPDEFEESLDQADVLEEIDAEHLESGIRRAPVSLPPPLPRAAAATIPAPPPTAPEAFSPRSSFPAATPPSVPPARGRLWADDSF